MRKHKLYEEFDNVYTPKQLAEVINNIKSENQFDNSVNSSEKDIRELILDYIMKFEGFRLRLREIHWETNKKSVHELTDSLINSLTEYEDEIAETTMGYFGFRIKVGDINPILSKSTDLQYLLNEIKVTTVDLKNNIDNKKDFNSLISILDDILNLISKTNYLSTFN